MARLFLNQPMITSLLRTRNDVGIHRKPAKIGITHKFERQAGKRDASWQWVNITIWIMAGCVSGWIQGYTGRPRNANSTRRIVSLLPDI
jgi:hypothetical protein